MGATAGTIITTNGKSTFLSTLAELASELRVPAPQRLEDAQDVVLTDRVDAQGADLGEDVLLQRLHPGPGGPGGAPLRPVRLEGRDRRGAEGERFRLSTKDSNTSFDDSLARALSRAFAIHSATSSYGSAGIWRRFTPLRGSAASITTPAGSSVRRPRMVPPYRIDFSLTFK